MKDSCERVMLHGLGVAGGDVRLAVPALERLGDDLMAAGQLALRAGRGAHRAAVDALRRRRQVVLRRARLSEAVDRGTRADHAPGRRGPYRSRGSGGIPARLRSHHRSVGCEEPTWSRRRALSVVEERSRGAGCRKAIFPACMKAEPVEEGVWAEERRGTSLRRLCRGAAR